MLSLSKLNYNISSQLIGAGYLSKTNATTSADFHQTVPVNETHVLIILCAYSMTIIENTCNHPMNLILYPVVSLPSSQFQAFLASSSPRFRLLQSQVAYSVHSDVQVVFALARPYLELLIFGTSQMKICSFASVKEEVQLVRSQRDHPLPRQLLRPSAPHRVNYLYVRLLNS